MKPSQSSLIGLACAAALAAMLAITPGSAAAQNMDAEKGGAPKPVAEQAPTAADPEQLRAAERVLFGDYDCEFDQKLKVNLDARYPGYVQVLGVGVDFLMKPVASSTGAIRLEDVKSIGLLLQVAGKSMLMNTKTGQRMMDNCVHPEQRAPAKN
jgi:hypothetical protein